MHSSCKLRASNARITLVFAIFAITTAIVCAALPAKALAADGTTSPEEMYPLQTYQTAADKLYTVGDVVYFGRYWQDEISSQSEIDVIKAKADFDDNGEAVVNGIAVKVKDGYYYKKRRSSGA